MDNQITLTNTIAIEINKNLDKAIKYGAPSMEGNVLGLGSFTYYIL